MVKSKYFKNGLGFKSKYIAVFRNVLGFKSKYFKNLLEVLGYKHKYLCYPTLILFRQQDKEAVGTHFSADDHNGTEDLIISVLAFITSHPESKNSLDHRLKVEKEWIHRMRCPAPTGLNIFD